MSQLWQLCLAACLLLVMVSEIEGIRLRRQAEREDESNNEVNPGTKSTDTPTDQGNGQSTEGSNTSGGDDDNDSDSGHDEPDEDDFGMPDFSFGGLWTGFDTFRQRMEQWRLQFQHAMQEIRKQLQEQFNGWNGTSLSCSSGEGNSTSKIVEYGGQKWNVTTTVCEKHSGQSVVYSSVTSMQPAKRRKRSAMQPSFHLDL